METLFVVLKILGSLGLFLYGMKTMSEALQRSAGGSLREILSKMTQNRWLGLGAGMLITMFVQSSSATTVMTVSFVNAGLLTLTESAGVLMGANIGTTVTAWLITFVGKLSIASYAYVILAFGFPLMFFKANRIKTWAEVIIGFAILFLGLSALKNSMPDLNVDNPQIQDWLANHSNGSFFDTILFVFIGTLLTIILQSSSATMALTLTVIMKYGLPMEIAVALVLGENIGTTVTAILAASIGNASAKRASRIHFLFNVFGVVWMLLIMQPFLEFVSHFMVPNLEKMMPNVMRITTNGVVDINAQTSWTLTVFHSSFNILNALILIWFIKPIVNVATKLVRDDDDTDYEEAPEDLKVDYIGIPLVESGEVATMESAAKIKDFAKLTKQVFVKVGELFKVTDPFDLKSRIDGLQEMENKSDRYEESLSKYLLTISQEELNEHTSQKVLSQFDIIKELEYLCDISVVISKDIRKIHHQNPFPQNYYTKFASITDKIQIAFDDMIYNLNEEGENLSLEKTQAISEEIKAECTKFSKDVIKKMAKDKKYNYRSAGTMRDIIGKLTQVRFHITKISRTLKGIYTDEGM